MVSGAPGTGKSTIARGLGAALRLPVLSLDPIKEALADVLGLGDEDWSNRLGDAAAEVVFRLAADFPDAVAEGWWQAVGVPTRLVHLVIDAADPVALPLVFRSVPEAKTGKNRVHLDLATKSAAHQAAAVTVLLAAGAVPADLGQGSVSWTVLADPEGSEFCVLSPG